MKTIVLSFDDGRSDLFQNAVPILKRYGFAATVNIATEYIIRPQKYMEGSFKNRSPMRIEQVIDLEKLGYEIAGHSYSHSNTVEDIEKGIIALKDWGINKISGFASPYSFLTLDNSKLIRNSRNDLKLSYIRSGIQTRREGLVYSCIFFLQEKTRSRFLFYLLNQKSVICRKSNDNFYIGITITNKTTVDQIMYMMNRIPDNAGIILILHSILNAGNVGYMNDKWGWSVENLSMLCEKVKSSENITIRTTRDFLNEMRY